MFETWAVSACWFTIGAMIFFGTVIAPTVFKSLSSEDAGVFLRQLFPRLYLFCGVTTALAGAALVASGTCILFFYCRGPLTAQINDARDQELIGKEGAKALFDSLHKRSVRIFGLQALALVGVSVYVQMM